MTPEIVTLFTRLPDVFQTRHDLSYVPDADSFVARIGAPRNLFGEYRRLAANKGWLRIEVAGRNRGNDA